MSYILIAVLTAILIAPFDSSALDLGAPILTEPLQKKHFFDTQRFFIGEQNPISPSLLEPQLSFSHDAREENLGVGVNQKIHSLRGEVGGKLNLMGDISLTAVTRIPVYKYEVTQNERILNGGPTGELLKKPGRLSWRSELGVPIKGGVKLDIFYDNSTFMKTDRPGLEERDEKFGTRFIIKFK